MERFCRFPKHDHILYECIQSPIFELLFPMVIQNVPFSLSNQMFVCSKVGQQKWHEYILSQTFDRDFLEFDRAVVAAH